MEEIEITLKFKISAVEYEKSKTLYSSADYDSLKRIIDFHVKNANYPELCEVISNTAKEGYYLSAIMATMELQRRIMQK